MQLTMTKDYGIRFILFLAAQGTTCTSAQIADETAAPRTFLIQLAQKLRKAELIAAVPGKNGGYYLAKSPSEISLRDIFEALDGGNRMLADDRFDASDGAMTSQISRIYRAMGAAYDTFLSSLTVDVLLEGAESSPADSL